MSKFFEKTPFHFILFAFYPFLSLYFHNAQQIPAYASSRALLFSIVLLILSFLISLLLLHNLNRAALLTSLALLLFYAYGHVYDLLEVHFPYLAHHSLLAGLALIVLLVVFISLLRTHASLFNLNLILNSITLLLVVLVAADALLKYANGQWFAEVHAPVVKEPAANIQSTVSSDLPDVYYFLLDSYARQDKLMEVEKFDNSAFIEQLRQRGFVIPSCTQSNYDNTLESVSSSLNMNYLDRLNVDTSMDGEAEMVLTSRLIQHNLVRNKFKDLAYTTYAFATKAPFVNLSDSDYYYDVNARTAYIDRIESLNFYELFLNTTALRLVWQTELNQAALALPLKTIQWIEPQLDTFSTMRYHEYLQNKYTLDKLMDIPSQPGPKFIYAHLMDVHSSYVYNPNGTFMIQSDESKAAYI
ncbi:MAG: hypothetical protein LWX83_15885, partial [Anaerolineae bacterium]|nr:hypothetical protein [Anaerolineae bacterium]